MLEQLERDIAVEGYGCYSLSDLIHTCSSKEKQVNANLEQVQQTVLTFSFAQQRQLV